MGQLCPSGVSPADLSRFQVMLSVSQDVMWEHLGYEILCARTRGPDTQKFSKILSPVKKLTNRIKIICLVSGENVFNII